MSCPSCNACCCKPCNTNKSCVSCLGRCGLPKHKCETKKEIRPGPVPKCMGWDYTAKDAPDHQLKCGWRPGHIMYPVLRKVEAHYCNMQQEKPGLKCDPPKPPCCAKRPKCPSNTCVGSRCKAAAASPGCCVLGPSPPCDLPCCAGPSIRIIRHNGTYSICTKPDDMDNSPGGTAPLKYVLNTDLEIGTSDKEKYAIEAKFNDLHFDYVSSKTSFVLDFMPPACAASPPCGSPCPKPPKPPCRLGCCRSGCCP